MVVHTASMVNEKHLFAASATLKLALGVVSEIEKTS